MMHEVELLQKIRPIWLHRAVQLLARGTSVREGITHEMGEFFDGLEQAIESGDPSWVDPSLNAWASSLTETDLEANTSSPTGFVSQLLNLTLSVCLENLDSTQALQMISALMPSFTHAYEVVAKAEIQTRIAYVSNQLTQVQQTLDRLDRSKSDFIAVAAHELKTPLTLIDGYTAMLREASEKNGRDANDFVLLTGISNGTRRLRGIVDDMIDVSLIDNNLLKLNLQPLWLNRLFQVLENEIKPALAERNQRLDVDSFPGCSEMTFGDPERLMQVFRNLLINAVKFTPDGGRIHLSGRKLPGFIEVTIEDNGIGIDPEDQLAIFEKFGTIGNTALHSSGKIKFKGGGPGLGLHIVKGIVESHGGAVWVESPGCDEVKCPGSTFHVLLPIRVEPPDEKMARIFSPLTQNQP